MMLNDLEDRRNEFHLLACLDSHLAAKLTAAGAFAFFFGQLVAPNLFGPIRW
jgi:hypothetical protein